MIHPPLVDAVRWPDRPVDIYGWGTMVRAADHVHRQQVEAEAQPDYDEWTARSNEQSQPGEPYAGPPVQLWDHWLAASNQSVACSRIAPQKIKTGALASAIPMASGVPK